MATKSWILLAVACLLSDVIADGDDEGRDYRDLYEYADDGHEEENCPEMNLPSRLVGRCGISDFCSNITCQLEVAGKRSTVIFKINRCEDPITATVIIKSSGFSVDWTHTFKDGEIIEIVPAADRGDMNSMARVSLSVRVDLKKEGKKLHFKLLAIVDGPALELQKLDRQTTTLLDGKITLSTKHCGFSAWFNKQPRYIKALVSVGPIVAFIGFLVLIACCCARCRRRAPARLHVQLPSHRVQTFSTKSRVPMQRLVNEK